LVSLDATTRSNITVGPPFEVATYAKDSLTIGCRCRFEADDPYLVRLREAWNSGIKQAFTNLPRFDWEAEGTEQMALQPLTMPNG
jgi:putative proteasome-type protease